jgi:hypothetical protein
MSAQAIKSFFRSQKRAPKRSRLSNEDSNEVTDQQLATSDVEEAIATGKPYDSSGLFKYLTKMYDEPEEEIIVPEPVVVSEPTPKRNYGIRIVEITDEMIRQKEQEQAYREEEEYFRSFQSYVPPPRPKEQIDEQLDEFNFKLEKAKKELDEELIKPIPNVKGYIPPTKKKEYNLEFNNNVRKLNMDISNLENGIKELIVTINRKNDQWIQLRKTMYRSEYIRKQIQELSKMQEEIANSANLQMQ